MFYKKEYKILGSNTNLFLSITLLQLNVWVFTSGVVKGGRPPTFDACFTLQTKETFLKAVGYAGHSLQEFGGMSEKVGEVLYAKDRESTRESGKNNCFLVPPRKVNRVVAQWLCEELCFSPLSVGSLLETHTC